MGRHPKGPDERTVVLSLRVREVALAAAIEKAGGRDALIDRLRQAVELYAVREATVSRPATAADSGGPGARLVEPIPKQSWKGKP